MVIDDAELLLTSAMMSQPFWCVIRPMNTSRAWRHPLPAGRSPGSFLLASALAARTWSKLSPGKAPHMRNMLQLRWYNLHVGHKHTNLCVWL